MPIIKENTSGGAPDEAPRKFEISGGQDVPDTLLKKDNIIPDTTDLQDLSTDQQMEISKENEKTDL